MEKFVRERVNEFLKNKRFTVNALSKELNINQRTLNGQLRENIAMSVNTLCAILERFPELSAEWILRGTEPMLLNGQATQSNIHGDNIQGGHVSIQQADQQVIQYLKQQLEEEKARSKEYWNTIQQLINK